MRGNYQEEEPLIKFKPETSGASRIYQNQHYTKQHNDGLHPELQESYSLVNNNKKQSKDHNKVLK